MALTGKIICARNSELSIRCSAPRDQALFEGIDSSTGFRLSDGSMFSPGAFLVGFGR